MISSEPLIELHVHYKMTSSFYRHILSRHIIDIFHDLIINFWKSIKNKIAGNKLSWTARAFFNGEASMSHLVVLLSII